MIDWRGNEYGVGDTILYATSSSSHVYMNEGWVVEIVDAPHSWKDETTKKLKVQPLRYASSYGGNKWEEGKLVTLSALQRVTFLEAGH